MAEPMSMEPLCNGKMIYLTHKIKSLDEISEVDSGLRLAERCSLVMAVSSSAEFS